MHKEYKRELQGVFFLRARKPHVIFINLDSAIDIAVRSKKSRAVALVKWLNKKGVEKIQEEH